MTWLITRRDVLAAPYVLLLLTAHMAYCQPIGLRLSAKELFVLAQRADAINDKVNVALIYEALEQDSNRDIRNEARFRYAAFQSATVLLLRPRHCIDAYLTKNRMQRQSASS
jgi:hypothetical protein